MEKDKTIAINSVKSVKKLIKDNAQLLNKQKIPRRQNAASFYIFDNHEFFQKSKEEELSELLLTKKCLEHKEFKFIKYYIPKSDNEYRPQTLLSPLTFAYSTFLVDKIRHKFNKTIKQKKFYTKIKLITSVDFDPKKVLEKKFSFNYINNYNLYKNFIKNIKSNIFYKTDFKNCYNSIQIKNIKNFLKSLSLDEKDINSVVYLITLLNFGDKGIPQTKGISPFDSLFTMYLYWVFSEFINKHPKCLKYAVFYVDDGLLVPHNKKIYKLKNNMQQFFKNYDLYINEDKSYEINRNEFISLEASNDDNQVFNEVLAKEIGHVIKKYDENKIITCIELIMSKYKDNPKQKVKSKDFDSNLIKGIFEILDVNIITISELTNIFIKSLSDPFPKQDSKRCSPKISEKIVDKIKDLDFLNQNPTAVFKILQFIKSYHFDETLMKWIDKKTKDKELNKLISPYFKLWELTYYKEKKYKENIVLEYLEPLELKLHILLKNIEPISYLIKGKNEKKKLNDYLNDYTSFQCKIYCMQSSKNLYSEENVKELSNILWIFIESANIKIMKLKQFATNEINKYYYCHPELTKDIKNLFELRSSYDRVHSKSRKIKKKTFEWAKERFYQNDKLNLANINIFIAEIFTTLKIIRNKKNSS